MREVFEKIGEEIERAGYKGMLPAGLVMTGGASQLAGTARLGREVLGMPVRVAGPSGVAGPDRSPADARIFDIARVAHVGRAGRAQLRAAQLRLGTGAGIANRMREWARGLLP